MYKGMASPMIGQVVINAIVFGVHGNTLRRLNDKRAVGNFIAGGLAGGVQTFVCSPIELIKTRMQLQGQGESRKFIFVKKDDLFRYSDPVDCMAKILKYEGLRGFFRGFYCTLLREVPSFAVYFSSYYALCEKLGANKGTLSIPKLFLSGGISGILAWIVSYPFDVIKTRLQADGMGKTIYTGILDCSLKSYEREGLKVFFKGLNATLLRAFPTNAATLASVTVFLEMVEPEQFEEFFKPSDHYNYEHVHSGWSI